MHYASRIRKRVTENLFTDNTKKTTTPYTLTMATRTRTRPSKVSKPIPTTPSSLDITPIAERVLMDMSESDLNSSQDQSQPTPTTSPLRLTETFTRPKGNTQTLKQSYLSFGLSERKKCQQCGMTYSKNLKSDVKFHQKYHERALDGRDWNSHWGEKIEELTPNEYIVKINPARQAETNAAIEMLDIVNKELNAPHDNEFWMAGEKSGSVYVYVKNKVAVGVVSVERRSSGFWFSVEDGKIISNKQIPVLAGISRIHTCQHSRRQGIAMKLLACVQDHLIYGMVIPSRKISWSQPSFSGGKLAIKFNGVKHKSGKVLVPVYV